MPTVTITLTDTPTGSLSVHSSYKPSLGSPTSLAQAAAQDIINRTCHAYGLPNPMAPRNKHQPDCACAICELQKSSAQ